MSTTAVIPTAPAAAPVEAPEVSVQERLDRATSAELTTWRKDGTIPEAKPPKAAESATVEPEIKEPPATEESAPSKPSETAAAPEAAKPQKKRDAEGRVKQLLDRIAELEKRLPADNSRETKQEARPATETTKRPPKPTPGDVDDKGLPKYGTWQNFEDARDQWVKDEAIHEFEQRSAKTAKENEAAQQERVINDKQQQKAAEARKKFADFDIIALSDKLVIPKHSAVDLFVIQSDRGMEVLYELGKNDGAELARISKLNALSQVMELTKLELKLAEPSSASRETPTKLPPPPTELSARRSAPVDEAESALARGDTAGYMRAMNARELKARKG